MYKDNVVSQNACSICSHVVTPGFFNSLFNSNILHDCGECDRIICHSCSKKKQVGQIPIWSVSQAVFKTTEQPAQPQRVCIECLSGLFKGKYEILKDLGEGAFGKVYLVRTREDDGVRWAMKSFKRRDEMNAREFYRHQRQVEDEANILRRLNHVHVIKYADAFMDHRVLYVCMEFASEGDLFQKISQQRHVRKHLKYRRKHAGTNKTQKCAKCTAEEQLAMHGGMLWTTEFLTNWFKQLVHGLYYLHSMRIMHRDIKPVNILVAKKPQPNTCDDGENASPEPECTLKIGDFGSATDFQENSSSMDYARTAIGNALYMSPEAHNDGRYSYASDVWSLGCVLYEMWCANKPFNQHLFLKLSKDPKHSFYKY